MYISSHSSTLTTQYQLSRPESVFKIHHPPTCKKVPQTSMDPKVPWHSQDPKLDHVLIGVLCLFLYYVH